MKDKIKSTLLGLGVTITFIIFMIGIISLFISVPNIGVIFIVIVCLAFILFVSYNIGKTLRNK